MKANLMGVLFAGTLFLVTSVCDNKAETDTASLQGIETDTASQASDVASEDTGASLAQSLGLTVVVTDPEDDVVDTVGPVVCPKGSFGEALFAYPLEQDQTIRQTALDGEGNLFLLVENTHEGDDANCASLYALDCTGQLRWMKNLVCGDDAVFEHLSTSFVWSILIGPTGRIYLTYQNVEPDEPFLAALDPSGNVVMKAFVDAAYYHATEAPMTIDDQGTIYVSLMYNGPGEEPNAFIAVKADGSIKEVFPTIWEDHAGYPQSLIHSDGILYSTVLTTPGYGSATIATSAETGQKVWKIEADPGMIVNSAAYSQAAIDGSGNAVFVLWGNDHPGAKVLSKHLIVASPTGLVALDKVVGTKDLTGEHNDWTPMNPVIGSSATGDIIFVSFFDLGSIHAYAGVSGDELFQAQVAQMLASTMVLGDDGKVYVLGVNGVTVEDHLFLAAVTKDGVELADTGIFSHYWDDPLIKLVMGQNGVLYIPGDGALHAVATDATGMDPSAPWPCYRHDAGSTGNAGP